MAYLCYKCYSSLCKEDNWEKFPCNTQERKTCENCGLTGIYVRDIKKEEI